MMGKFSIFDQVRREGRSILTEFESKRILKQAGLSVVETKLAETQKEAVLLSQKMGFPVALKIASPDVIHKSDSGGVKLPINSVAEVKKAYNEILKKVAKEDPSIKVEN
jgi:acyl-CoA synthetase (NDP forming)